MEYNIFILLLLATLSFASRPSCYDPLQIQYPIPPLCGNGILDPGELCDDGNQLNNDGCDSTCTFFDAFAPPCTLAGKSTICPYGRTLFSNTMNPTKTTFCNLRAMSIHPLGRYLIFADNNLILKYSLFTDDISNAISVLTINTQHTFQPICSLHVLSDSSILTYECTKFHRLGLISPFENSFVTLQEFPTLLPILDRGINLPKILALPEQQRVILAGVSKQANDTSIIGEFRTCVEIYISNLPLSFSSAVNPNTPISPWTTIPCIVYNAFENDNTRYLTYDMTSMIPSFVLYDSCIQTYILDQKCIVIHMQNANLQRVIAYIPENGGFDIHYTVFSNSLMNNALGLPRIKLSNDRNVQYTLQASCFRAEQIVSKESGLFVQRSLGSVCEKIASSSRNEDCITPLNNPFITEVLTSQNLLPEGLTSSTTHWELSQIFANLDCNSTSSSTSLSGSLYYRKILESVYSNTLPVDFEENPYTKDIFFITQTTLGLIGTKRFSLMDNRNLGYCKATNVIACPNAYFGSVETGICYPCNSSNSPGYGISVAWQIKCALKELKSSTTNNKISQDIQTNSHQPTMESYTNFISRSITDIDLHSSICLLMKAFKKPCPISLDMISREQHNTAADEIDYQNTNSELTNEKPSSIIKCLIDKTEKRFNINITNDENAEYIAKWVTTGTEIIDSLSIDFNSFFNTFTPKNDISSFQYNGEYLNQNETDILRRCLYNQNIYKLSYWLKCSIPIIAMQRTNQVPMGRRRLLQQSASTTNIFINENNALSLISSTPVIFNPLLPDETTVTIKTSPPSASVDSFPLWTGVGVGIAGAVVIIILLFCICYRRSTSIKND